MKTYPENTDLSFEISPVDAEGNAYEGECTLSYDLTDVDGKIVCSGEVTTTPFAVAISAESNKITNGNATDIRFLKIRFLDADGKLISQQQLEYLLQNENPLTVGENSFVTLEQFKLLAQTIPNLEYLAKATDTQIINALLESYEKIARLRYRLNATMRMDNVAYISEVAWRPRAITDDDPLSLTSRRFTLEDLTPEAFATLPERFRKALAKAQVVECNAVLSPTDTIEDRRRKGVILETINEVKMMFSSTTPIKNSVASKTISILYPWLDNSIRIRRV